MNRCAHFTLLADYNCWINERVYAAAARLDGAALTADRGAFFGSILGTLNHLVVADLMWLRRFALHPSRPAVLDALAAWPVPAALAELLYPDFAELQERRVALDVLIQQWAGALHEADLNVLLEYRNSQGLRARRDFGCLLVHFFNHQTHHRGQLSALLTQAGQDVGVTDLLMMIPDAG